MFVKICGGKYFLVFKRNCNDVYDGVMCGLLRIWIDCMGFIIFVMYW